MEITNTADIKNYLHRLIVETDDLEILTEIKNYFISKNKPTDWWETISEEEKHDIELGIKQLNAGEKFEYKQVKQKTDKLFGRL